MRNSAIRTCWRSPYARFAHCSASRNDRHVIEGASEPAGRSPLLEVEPIEGEVSERKDLTALWEAGEECCPGLRMIARTLAVFRRHFCSTQWNQQPGKGKGHDRASCGFQCCRRPRPRRRCASAGGVGAAAGHRHLPERPRPLLAGWCAVVRCCVLGRCCAMKRAVEPNWARRAVERERYGRPARSFALGRWAQPAWGSAMGAL